MTERKDKLNRVVKFAQTEADQILMQAVESCLRDQAYSSFSDLCKQALRQLLFPSDLPQPTIEFASVHQAVLLEMQQQLVALQIQVARLEGAAGVQQTCYVGRLEQRIVELVDRLDKVESQFDTAGPHTPAVPAPAVEEIDPLLSRLAPLLEDF